MDLCFTWRVCRLGFTIDICGYGNWAAMSQETCEGRGIGSGRIIEGKIGRCLSARALWVQLLVEAVQNISVATSYIILSKAFSLFSQQSSQRSHKNA